MREPPEQGIFPAGHKFSEKSQKLIANVNNTEIFELCETSSKKQCPDCNLHWEIGIIYCTLWKMFQIFAKKLRSWTRTATTSYQFQAMLSKRTPFAVPNMDFLNGNECTARLRTCCKKLDNPSMEDIIPYLRDGTKTTNTEVLCHSSGGSGSKLLKQYCLGGPFIRRQKT